MHLTQATRRNQMLAPPTNCVHRNTFLTVVAYVPDTNWRMMLPVELRIIIAHLNQ